MTEGTSLGPVIVPLLFLFRQRRCYDHSAIVKVFRTEQNESCGAAIPPPSLDPPRVQASTGQKDRHRPKLEQVRVIRTSRKTSTYHERKEGWGASPPVQFEHRIENCSSSSTTCSQPGQQAEHAAAAAACGGEDQIDAVAVAVLRQNCMASGPNQARDPQPST